MSWLKLLKLRSLFIPEGVRLHLHPAGLERMDLKCWIHTMSCGNLQTSHKCKNLEELQNIIWQWWDRDNLYYSMSWSRKWQPTSVFLPGKFHGQGGLADYSPWGHKESDMTEQLTLSSLSLLYPGLDVGDGNNTQNYLIIFRSKWRAWVRNFGGSLVKNSPGNAGDMGLIPGSEDPLEKKMATHSNILAWEIP